MTQEERQGRSRQRILAAALEEFGAAEYEAVTMDRICAGHNISKGMMYHYYSNKDELYLLCVEDTFRLLKDYIEAHARKPDGQNTLETIQNYVMLRKDFAEQHPQRRQIYETAAFHPPAHLAEAIDRLYTPLAQFDQAYVEDVVAHMPLRRGVKPENAVRMLTGIEYLARTAASRGINFPDGEAARVYLNEILDMALYGLLGRGPEAPQM